jgi:hypothetical protein
MVCPRLWICHECSFRLKVCVNSSRKGQLKLLQDIDSVLFKVASSSPTTSKFFNCLCQARRTQQNRHSLSVTSLPLLKKSNCLLKDSLQETRTSQEVSQVMAGISAPILDDSNYVRWRIAIRDVLMANEFQGLMDGSLPRPSTRNTPEDHAWTSKDAKTRCLIRQSKL